MRKHMAMKRKMMSAALALAMVATAIPAPAMAKEIQAGSHQMAQVQATIVDGIEYRTSVENGGLTITGAGPVDSDNMPARIEIPATLENVQVTSIGRRAFYMKKGLEEVTIPEGVTSIGEEAFFMCSDLTNVSLPDSLVSIDTDAFWLCENLTSVNLPENLQEIGEGAFAGCSFSEAVIPESVTSIGAKAFSGCTALTKAVIPSGITEIPDGIFNSCQNLKSVTIPDGVTRIGAEAFTVCHSLTSVEIPSSVTSIDYRAFYWCISLETITFPDGVTDIGEEAFSSCNELKSISFSNSVETIGAYAFSECGLLPDITLPDSLITIGEGAFSKCELLTGVTIPKNVSDIGVDAFAYNHDMKTITVDAENDSYASQDGILFSKDKTELVKYPEGREGNSYSIPASVSVIAPKAVFRCINLNKVIIPASVADIGAEAFGCSFLEDITVAQDNPNYASQDGVLFNKDMTVLIQYPNDSWRESYTVPSTVTEIGAKAFYDCLGVCDVVTIPESVTRIGEEAFYDCDNLWRVKILGDVTDMEEFNVNHPFKQCDNLTIFGKTASNVQAYADRREIPFIDLSSIVDMNACTISPIPPQTYKGGYSVKPSMTVTYGDTVLEEDVHYYIHHYENNHQPGTASVTIVGMGVYFGTKTATFTILPAAGGGTGSDNVSVSKAVTAKNQKAEKVNRVIITADTSKKGSATIRTIKKNNRKTITIPSKITVKGVKYDVTAIGAKAFKNCKKATKLILPASVTRIDKNAFAGAKKVKVIKLNGKKAPTIKKGAFKGLNTKKITLQVKKSMSKKQYKKLAKAAKAAGFKGKIKKVK